MGKLGSSVLEGTLREEYRSVRCDGDTADLDQPRDSYGHCRDISDDNYDFPEYAGVRRYVFLCR